MDSQKISNALECLKINSRGQIRGKNKVINEIHSQYLKNIHEISIDLRACVSKIPNYRNKEVIKAIENFIYRITI